MKIRVEDLRAAIKLLEKSSRETEVNAEFNSFTSCLEFSTFDLNYKRIVIHLPKADSQAFAMVTSTDRLELKG